MNENLVSVDYLNEISIELCKFESVLFKVMIKIKNYDKLYGEVL